MRERAVIGNIYHVLSRGADKRPIFLNEGDYIRFIHDLFEFNDQNPLNNLTYRFRSKVIARPYIHIEPRVPRRLLVKLLAFCLMENHYHLLLQPVVNGALPKFMKKLNMGYSRYFNEKYHRSGTLFEGRYKSIGVTEEAHLLYLPYYIHCNPLDLFAPGWRQRSLIDYEKAVQYLATYRWSSHRDYLGGKNFPSVTQRDFLEEIIGRPQEYATQIKKWLKDMDLSALADSTLE